MLLHFQVSEIGDRSLYHLQTFKWNREFPVTAGLGNLYGPLAHNSILFLIAPLTDRIEIGWISNLLAVTFVMLSLWSRLRRDHGSDHRGSMQYWFIALVVSIFVLRPGWLNWLFILNADAVATVLIGLAALLFGILTVLITVERVFALLLFSVCLQHLRYRLRR